MARKLSKRKKFLIAGAVVVVVAMHRNGVFKPRVV